MIYVKVEWDLEVDGKELTLEETGLKEIVQLPELLFGLSYRSGLLTSPMGSCWLDQISEWLSDEHGYCHKGFKILPENSS